MAVTIELTDHEVGELLRSKREALGLRQDQVIERAGIPTMTQLSEYERGKVSLKRSKYLPKLAVVLRLTAEEVHSINPDAVINMQAQPESPKRIRRPVQTRSKVTGDMTIPPAKEGYTNELLYDKTSTSGMVVTEAGGRYWIWESEHVPSGHRVLGEIHGWNLEPLKESDRPD